MVYQFTFVLQKQTTKTMTQFKKEVIDLMLSDPKLYGAIAEAKGIKPANLGTVIRRNGNAINQYAIVKLVSDYTGRTPDELVEPKDMTIAA